MKVRKTLNKRDTIVDHLSQVADMRIAVFAVIEKKNTLAQAQLRLTTASNPALFIEAPAGSYPAEGLINVHYAFDGEAHIFNCPIAASAQNHNQHSRIPLQLPGKIVCYDRRKYLRIEPEAGHPIGVRMRTAGHKPLKLELTDISGGGLSIIVPNDLPHFAVGAKFNGELISPDFNRLKIRLAVRSTYKFLNVMRVGFQFAELAEGDRNKIMEYTVRRELDLRRHQASAAEHALARVLLVEAPDNYKTYNYLTNKYEIDKADSVKAIERMLRKEPETVLVNLDLPDAGQILKVLRSDAYMQYRPLVLFSSQDRCLLNTATEMVCLKSPVTPKILVNTLDNLIKKNRLAQKAIHTRWQMFSGFGQRVLLLDVNDNIDPAAETVLKNCDFRVMQMNGTAPTIANLVTKNPTVIVIDDQTGDVAPIALCRLMQMNKRLKAIPKILSFNNKKQALKARSEGLVDALLKKPFTPDMLLERIHTVL